MDNPYQPPQTAPLEPQAGTRQTVLASRWARLAAALIDSVIAGAASMALVLVVLGYDFKAIATMDLAGRLVLAGLGVATFLVLHGYLLAKNGQTIGKLVLGIRIARLDGSVPEFAPLILKRYLPVWVLAQIPVIGGLLNLVNVLFIFRADKRCVHDLIAGTMVVKAS